MYLVSAFGQRSFFPDRLVSLPFVRKYLRDNERHYLAKKVRTTIFPMTTNLTLGKLLETLHSCRIFKVLFAPI